MRIVFMGTPDFAVASLKALVESEHEVVGVITATDKVAGRGNKLRPSPVKVFAESAGLKVLQPKNLKNQAFLEELRALEADLQVVVAFRMLPALVFEMSSKGCINLHGSLLPQYRGAAPINWAVINGETETGVTSFFIRQEIDTGAMIYQERLAIGPDMTAGNVHDGLMEIGAKLIVKTVDDIANGTAPRNEQPTAEIMKKAPKIFKEDCVINWDQPAENVRNFIRGLSPYPAAYTFIDEKRCKVFKASIGQACSEIKAGTVSTDNENYIKVATQDFFLKLEEIQLAGKKRMDTPSLLRGTKLSL